mmetsp:Transcript_22711/g.71442  ORF Transcript_22711/g.71442 Transcript_22711/m.71442 type:complete len:99 (+) Transcript_22711:301-597(+)
MAKASQVLFTGQMLAEAEEKGPDMVGALLKLREAARLDIASKRQVLRVLLRDWHPDKHQGSPKEEQEHANSVFCYIQGLRSLFLGPEAEAAGEPPGKG